jgi:cell division GTPase FtsZ
MSTDFLSNFLDTDEEEEVVAHNLDDVFSYPVAMNFVVLGVGQGGNNLADAFYEIGYRRVGLLNTAKTDMDTISHPIIKVALDKQGAGKDPEIGRNRVEAKSSKIRSLLAGLITEKTDKVIVCLGLGGGTGSGGGPEVVKMVQEWLQRHGKDPHKDVIVIQTLPEPLIEGDRPSLNALYAYREIDRLKVPTLTVDNAQLRKCVRTTISAPWFRLNRWIVETFHQFNIYAAKETVSGNIDMRDLEDVLSRGRFIFSAFRVTQVQNKETAGTIMADHLEKSLFAKTNIRTSRAAALIMLVNEETMGNKSLDEISEVAEELNALMGPNSTLHRSIHLAKFPSKPNIPVTDMFCYVLLGELGHPLETLNGLFARAKHLSGEYSSLTAFLNDGGL